MGTREYLARDVVGDTQLPEVFVDEPQRLLMLSLNEARAMTVAQRAAWCAQEWQGLQLERKRLQSQRQRVIAQDYGGGSIPLDLQYARLLVVHRQQVKQFQDGARIFRSVMANASLRVPTRKSVDALLVLAQKLRTDVDERLDGAQTRVAVEVSVASLGTVPLAILIYAVEQEFEQLLWGLFTRARDVWTGEAARRRRIKTEIEKFREWAATEEGKAQTKLVREEQERLLKKRLERRK